MLVSAEKEREKLDMAFKNEKELISTLKKSDSQETSISDEVRELLNLAWDVD